MKNDLFSESEILELENQILKVMRKERSDFKEDLWEDFNFIYEAINYFRYDSNFYIYFELIEKKYYNNMFIISNLLENLRKAKNIMGSFLVLSSVPVNAWNDGMFLHNVVCSEIHALKYIPDELKTKDVIMNALYLVPTQENFDEYGYYNRYYNIIEYTPKLLWKDSNFVENIKKEFTKILEYVNVKNDILKLFDLIESKVNNK